MRDGREGASRSVEEVGEIEVTNLHVRNKRSYLYIFILSY